jgi:hypothetical protein
MCDLKTFDVQARGIAAIADDWSASGDEARGVWLISELVERLVGSLRDAQELYDDYRLGKLQDAGPFAYYVATFRSLVASGQSISEAVATATQDGYQVPNIDELNRLLSDVREIIDEDEFAQTMHSYED